MSTPTDGAAFLAQNGQREGVVTLPSGLQYEILAEGDGATPGPTSTVTTHYHGTLIDAPCSTARSGAAAPRRSR